MKTKIAFLLVLSLLIFPDTLISQSGWFWQNPLPQGNELMCIEFFNASTGYAAGYGGMFMKTFDAGNTWVNLPLPVTSGFLDMDFINESTGFLCGAGVYKTSNGGQNWITLMYSNNSSFQNIQFKDASTVYVHGWENYQYILYKSTNGGLNWANIASFSFPIQDIYFINSNTGYMVADISEFYKTTNGGNNWIELYTLGTNFINLKFIDENTGFISFSGYISKTTDGGLNWTNSYTGYNFFDFSFFDNQIGYACSDSGRVFKTTNCGDNWNPLNFTNSRRLNAIWCMSINNVIAVGAIGAIVRTINGGNNWFRINSGDLSFITDIDFANDNVGMAISREGKLFITTNGGINWNVSSLLNFYDSNSIELITSNTAYLSGPNALMKTTNTGTNWISLNMPASNYGPLCFCNKDSGVVYASNGNIYLTLDGGSYWKPHQIPGFYYATKIRFFPGKGYFMFSSSGAVYKSTDFGDSWILYNNYGSTLNDIYFINETTGFLLKMEAVYGKIYKTTNGGPIFIEKLNVFGQNFSSIVFVNNNTGFVCGYGYLRYTTDCGESWNISITNSSTSLPMNDITFVNEMTGYLCGQFGSILKSTSGGILTGNLKVVENYIPNLFSLHQNYPNPFNPVTKIKFEIPTTPLAFGEGLGVRLVIYDVLGREAAVLVNEQLKTGIYEVEFDGTNYPSGVYFYQLRTDKYVETRKMVLIK